MQAADIEKIRLNIKQKLSAKIPVEGGGAWLEHHVQMMIALFEAARAQDASLILEDFLKDFGQPDPKVKRRRGR